MKCVFFTFDYELGMTKSGSVEKSLIIPTNRYRRIFFKYNIKATWFVDAAYLLRLKELKNKNECLRKDYNLVIKQIKELKNEGHDIQLHIHPQWQFSIFENGKWKMDNGEHYKLSDLSTEEATKLFKESQELLESIIGKKPIAFRAGGYTLQTWDYVNMFKVNGIKIDSSVRPNTYQGIDTQNLNSHTRQEYDYRKIENYQRYVFNNDVAIPEKSGDFIELPISNACIPKWKFLFTRYKYNTSSLLKLIGDANSGVKGMKRSSKIKEFLKKFTSQASLDSKSSMYLEDIYHIVSQKSDDFVVCSHPKGASEYSYIFLEEFIEKHRNANFQTISDIM